MRAAREADDAVVLDAAHEDEELLAPEAGEDVLGANEPGDLRRDDAEDGVARRVAVRVVDALEVVQIEEDDGEARAVPLGVGDLGAEALGEVLAGCRRASGRRGSRTSKSSRASAFSSASRSAEAEDDARSDLEAVGGGELGPLHLRAVDEHAVGGAQILRHEAPVVRPHDARVVAADAGLVEAHVGVLGAAEHGRRRGLRAGRSGRRLGPVSDREEGALGSFTRLGRRDRDVVLGAPGRCRLPILAEPLRREARARGPFEWLEGLHARPSLSARHDAVPTFGLRAE